MMKDHTSKPQFLLRALLMVAMIVVVSAPAWAAPCCAWCDNWPDPDRCYRVCIPCGWLVDGAAEPTEMSSIFGEELETATCTSAPALAESEEVGSPEPQIAAPLGDLQPTE